MKKYIALIIGFLLIGCGSPDSQSSVKLETAMDSVSYSIGVDIGKNMKAQELDINEKAMFEGWSS
ncbi:MAG: FKBP-type peptidyl-prolyl cis-trans isomerase N-terminal domain-containing protein, partial [Candidatus Marinimicrobia bacterium]|nr:FKBP-type peptidyl-prolyl cis-trans isomerase N-terminal domain-containing protein [Candidatus Neomarinimicrobiota bacterium]MDP7095287.1 FKBP-type peptidyl-prolyl cis-trans isomerase N-terminal domain-containing protein [Candidatus Neomarinimicrobiota bacterium]MDP7165439.1 FKBP-type peptidyl-prolyl cis-trans isomerase N-terminal domain-containing protein [Candidatus Neomarinimicrobiota bacterium]